MSKRLKFSDGMDDNMADVTAVHDVRTLVRDPRYLFQWNVSSRGGNTRISSDGYTYTVDLPNNIPSCQQCEIKVYDASVYYEGISSVPIANQGPMVITSDMNILGQSSEHVNSGPTQFGTMCKLGVLPHWTIFQAATSAQNYNPYVNLSMTGSERTYFLPGGLNTTISFQVKAVTLENNPAPVHEAVNQSDLGKLGWDLYMSIQVLGPYDLPIAEPMHS